MTPEQIQQKIYKGYAKAGQKLGALFDLYRSTTPFNPISEENLIGQIRASMSVEWTYTKSSKFGNAIFNACIDCQEITAPNSAQEGDYLVPAENGADENTYFVNSLQFDLPPQVVQCNRTISIIRPTQTMGPGYVGYGGYLPGESDSIMERMPASVLQKGKAENAPSNLPTDTRQPSWQILLPNLGGEVRIGDIVLDVDTDEEYVVTSNERTDLGFRLAATQVVNSR